MEIRTVAARMENLTEIMDFVDQFLDHPAYSEKVKYQVQVSVEEIFTNIASYAYADGEEGDIEVSCGFIKEADTEILQILFRDWGVPYNPLERPNPDFDVPFEERRIGGLGVYMVRLFMDQVEYSFEDGCNRLMIRKVL